MHQVNPQHAKLPDANQSALATTAGVYGIYAGVLGMEHGFFETLQGSAAPAHLKILASPWELPFPFGHEPAMTLIPNFLATGIAAMLCGLALIAWSARFLRSKRGAAVLALFSAVLLLVGGGFGPISLLVVACIAASRIGKAPKAGRTWIPRALGRALATAWPWFLIASLLWVPAEFIAGQVFHLQNDHRQVLSNLNLLSSYPMLGLFVLTLVAAIARERETEEVVRFCPPAPS